jgi:hypothetical protein
MTQKCHLENRRFSKELRKSSSSFLHLKRNLFFTGGVSFPQAPPKTTISRCAFDWGHDPEMPLQREKSYVTLFRQA